MEELYNKKDYQVWLSEDFHFESDSEDQNEEEVSSNDENYEGNDYPDEEKYHLNDSEPNSEDSDRSSDSEEVDDDNRDLYYTNKIYKITNKHYHYDEESEEEDVEYDLTGDYLYDDTEDNNDIRMANQYIEHRDDVMDDYYYKQYSFFICFYSIAVPNMSSPLVRKAIFQIVITFNKTTKTNYQLFFSYNDILYRSWIRDSIVCWKNTTETYIPWKGLVWFAYSINNIIYP